MVVDKKAISSKESGKRGPKTYWTTELLKNIVNRYFEECFVHGQVGYEDIAKFGREKLGFDEPNPRLIYQHFTRNLEVKQYIKNINESGLGGNISSREGNVVYTEFKPDQVMKIYGNDMKLLMPILRQFSDAHRMLHDENLDFVKKEIKYKQEIDDLKSKYKKLDEKFKRQKELLNKKFDEVKRLNNYKRLADEIAMREYIAEKTATKNVVFNEDNIKLIISAMNSTGGKKSSDKGFWSEEVDEDVIYDEVGNEIDDEEDDEYDTSDEKVIILKEKKPDKNDDEVNRLLSEIDDMI